MQDSDTYQYILKDKKERDHQKNIYIYSPSETKRQRLKRDANLLNGKCAAERSRQNMPIFIHRGSR